MGICVSSAGRQSRVEEARECPAGRSGQPLPPTSGRGEVHPVARSQLQPILPRVYSYGLYSYGLYSYGLCRYGLHAVARSQLQPILPRVRRVD